jgi:serine/threonine protein phosphatase PrpC
MRRYLLDTGIMGDLMSRRFGVAEKVEEVRRRGDRVGTCWPLVNCLGGYDENVHVETMHLPLVHGDRLLLCTDGLSDMVADAEIASILSQHPAPEEACQALVDAALEYGGKDNVTVVLGCVAMD